MIRPAACAAAMLLLLQVGCAGEKTNGQTLYTAPPEVLALFAGQSRGADLSLARACGADARRVSAAAAGDQAPTSFSVETAAIYKAALISRAESTTEKPAAEHCQAVRRNPDIAALFPPPPPLTRAEQAALAERRARAAPAYCAEGTRMLLLDATVTAGLKAIREKCRTGDSISIPAEASGIIASACDLARPVPVAGPNVFCTLGRIREMRSTAP